MTRRFPSIRTLHAWLIAVAGNGRRIQRPRDGTRRGRHPRGAQVAGGLRGLQLPSQQEPAVDLNLSSVFDTGDRSLGEA